MAASGAAFVDWVGSFFVADAGATAGATAADAAGTAAAGSTAAGATAAGTSAAGATAAGTGAAATDAAVTSDLAATTSAGIAAGSTTAPALGAVQGGIGDMTTAQVLSAGSTAATGASALNTLAQGRRGINIPPSPQPAAQTDEQVQETEQMMLRREQAAGGLQGTTGTVGGQAGSMLNPATTSSRSLLGA